jgi:hypothetical protein
MGVWLEKILQRQKDIDGASVKAKSHRTNSFRGYRRQLRTTLLAPTTLSR